MVSFIYWCKVPTDLIIWPNVRLKKPFEGDSMQTHAMCRTFLMPLSLWWRTIDLTKSTSSGLVPSLLFPDDSAFLRDGIEDEVPSATRIPSTFRSLILLWLVYLGDPEGRVDDTVGRIQKFLHWGTKANFQVRGHEIAIVLRTEG